MDIAISFNTISEVLNNELCRLIQLFHIVHDMVIIQISRLLRQISENFF